MAPLLSFWSADIDKRKEKDLNDQGAPEYMPLRAAANSVLTMQRMFCGICGRFVNQLVNYPHTDTGLEQVGLTERRCNPSCNSWVCCGEN